MLLRLPIVFVNTAVNEKNFCHSRVVLIFENSQILPGTRVTSEWAVNVSLNNIFFPVFGCSNTKCLPELIKCLLANVRHVKIHTAPVPLIKELSY